MQIINRFFTKEKKTQAEVVLQRVCENENGTFGVMTYKDIPLCVTVEDKWRENQRRVSCIPKGVYKCVKHNGTKYKNVWILKDVPNRSAILIHAGNTEDSTEGCIIAGSVFGSLGGKYAVLRSREAIRRLRAILPNKFIIEVK